MSSACFIARTTWAQKQIHRTHTQKRENKKLNLLMGTFKPQSNGPLYSYTVIGILAVDGWAVTFGTATMRLGGAANVTAHPSTASVPTSYYLMYNYNCLWRLKG